METLQFTLLYLEECQRTIAVWNQHQHHVQTTDWYRCYVTHTVGTVAF